ncbi:uncharacterized protein LOC115989526 isoform X3 [Quercus lobata]|uniref:uncharacterized protein LOC115989526 isoform X3 n=1 Tax=Quercus lobata TaxID=97700 RepID=UPI00124640FA|nr:uncharacterized protein LOC115989526 isoform X3 [Quercus lobata]
MTSFDRDLEEKLKEAGSTLLNPPSSIDDLLTLLDKVENLLANVEQAPSKSMQDALLPSLKALISNELLRHAEMDVKVSVASCITEITRITAPDAPYDDEQMKEIFQLTVAAFEKLSHVSSRCYTKAVSILDTVAKVRSCLVMLDLECDALVVEMFQNFLKIIRSNHPHAVFSAMETIMTLVIDESEEISSDLLSPLLASVRKENQNVSPISWKLGEKVITNCAVKLKPYLKEAVGSMGIALDDYAQIVTSVCQSESAEHLADENRLGKRIVSSELPRTDPNEASLVTKGLTSDTFKSAVINGTPTRNDENLKNVKSSKRLQSCRLTKHSKTVGASSNSEPDNLYSMKAAKSATESDSVPKKRGRKTSKLGRPRKSHDGGVDDSPSETPDTKAPSPLVLENVTEPSSLQPKTNKIITTASLSPDHCLPDASHPKRGRPKKVGNNKNQDANHHSLSMSKGGFLNAQVEEKALQSADVSLKKESEVTNNSDAKPQRHSRKVQIAIKINEETTQTPSHVVSEKEASDPSGPEEKLLQPSDMNVGVTNINNRSSIQTNSKKRKRKYASSEMDITEASNCKTISKSATKSANGDESYLEESPKTKLRRKSAAKGEDSGKPDFDERLVGCKIKVWWPKDKTFYEGVVHSYDSVKKKHQVLYTDGDEEILNLKKERWEPIVDDVLPEGGQETDLPKADASSDIRPNKRRGKTKSELAKQEKPNSSSKMSGTSANMSKVDSAKSGGNSADDQELDNPIIVYECVNNPSRTVEGSKDVGHQKSTSKSSIERLKSGNSMKPKGFL